MIDRANRGNSIYNSVTVSSCHYLRVANIVVRAVVSALNRPEFGKRNATDQMTSSLAEVNLRIASFDTYFLSVIFREDNIVITVFGSFLNPCFSF